MEEHLHFKIDWASLMVGIKFSVLLCFTLYLRVIFKYKPLGGLYLKGQFMEGLLHYWFGGLIFGGAYAWRGLFSEFYGICQNQRLR